MLDVIGGALSAFLGDYFDKKSFSIKKIFFAYFIIFSLTVWLYTIIDIFLFSDPVDTLKKEIFLKFFLISLLGGFAIATVLSILHIIARWGNKSKEKNNVG